MLLWIVCTGALAGIAFRVLWVGAPRRLYTPCYLALGWAPVSYLPDFLHTGGAAVVVLIVVGGLLSARARSSTPCSGPTPHPEWHALDHERHTIGVPASSSSACAWAAAAGACPR